MKVPAVMAITTLSIMALASEVTSRPASTPPRDTRLKAVSHSTVLRCDMPDEMYMETRKLLEMQNIKRH